MKYSKYISFFVLLFPIAVFAFVKPAKIVMPQVAGVECVKKWLCVDDLSRLEEAQTLYEDSLSKIEKRLAKFKSRPKVVFCSTIDCFSKFGFDRAAGKSIGGFGVVMGPRGWAPHYVEHELIHQWQSSNFGSIAVWRAPDWIIEGMAYSLSDDPRVTLSEPFQSYREKYGGVFGSLRGGELMLALSEEI